MKWCWPVPRSISCIATVASKPSFSGIGLLEHSLSVNVKFGGTRATYATRRPCSGADSVIDYRKMGYLNAAPTRKPRVAASAKQLPNRRPLGNRA